jgi:hypothetical protein
MTPLGVLAENASALETVIAIAVGIAAVIGYQIAVRTPAEGKWAQPKYVVLEVIVLAGVVIAAMEVWALLK